MAWAPDYVTLAEMKTYLRISDTNDDADLTLAIAAASRAVDECTGRQFGVVSIPELRYYPVTYDRHRCKWTATIDDLQTPTGLVLTPTDYTLERRNAVVEGLAWTGMTFDTNPGDEVAITALWGWLVVPSAVKLATKLQASRFHARRDSPYGVAGSPQTGSELRLLSKVDPDVAVSLKRYTRNWWAA